MKSQCDPPSKDLLEQLVKSELTYKEISCQLGVSTKYLVKLLTLHQLVRPSKPKIKCPGKDLLQPLVDQGLSLSNIGKIYDVDFSTVFRWLKKLDIKSNRKPGLTKGDKISPEALAKRPSMAGENNPFFGKKHTQSTKRNMSLNHADFTGDNNPFKKSLSIADNLERHKERCKTIWAERDEEWRRKFGEKLSERPLSNPSKQGKNHKCGYHQSSKITHEKMYYRSSWEYELAKKLDTSQDVSTYEYEQVRISYKNLQGNKRWSYADFVVQIGTHKVMIEVKPISVAHLKQEKIMHQIKWCVDKNIQYAIVDSNLIHKSFDLLVAAVKEGKLNASKYDRRGPITAEITADLIKPN